MDKHFYRFLQATCCNWRNSFFIDCQRCDGCSGFLLSVNHNAVPAIIPVAVFEELSGETVDKYYKIQLLDEDKKPYPIVRHYDAGGIPTLLHQLACLERRRPETVQSIPIVGELPTMNAHKPKEGGEYSEKSQYPLPQLRS